jgi:hypothetical protein
VLVIAAVALAGSLAQGPPLGRAADGLTDVRAERLAFGDVLVIGLNAERLSVIRVLDPASGRVRFETEGTAPQWFREVGYVLLRRDRGDYAFHVTTGRLEGPLPADEVAVRSVRDGTPTIRRNALKGLTTNPSLREAPRVRAALIDRLRLEVTGTPGPDFSVEDGVRYSRDYDLGLLVQVVGALRDPETAALIVKADVAGVAGALIDIGAPSVPVVLRAWQTPPSHPSSFYRWHLLVALHQLAELFPDVAGDQQVVQLLHRVLERPPDFQSLKEALEFADDLDDPEGLAYVRRYAYDIPFLTERVTGQEHVEEVQKAAQRLLERRIVIR